MLSNAHRWCVSLLGYAQRRRQRQSLPLARGRRQRELHIAGDHVSVNTCVLLCLLARGLITGEGGEPVTTAADEDGGATSGRSIAGTSSCRNG